MKFAKGLVAGIAAMSMALSAQAGGSVGVKLWNAQFDNGIDEDALMIGPTLSFGGDTVWVSAMYLQGKTKETYTTDEWGNDGSQTMEIDMADAEAVLGLTFDILDVGIGARYTLWTGSDKGEKTGELQIWGPMAYLALGSSFGDSPIGWYAGASYMFKDLGDANNAKYADVSAATTFEHINAEAGVSFSAKHIQATLGYRMKYYLNYNNPDKTIDLGHNGVAASASFVF